MSETPIKIVVNCETGEVQELPLTAEEIAERDAHAQALVEEQAVKEAEAIAAAEAKAALLQKLGITEDEAKLLLS